MVEILVITVVILILASAGLFYRHSEPLAVPSVKEGMTEEKDSFSESMAHLLSGLLNRPDKGMAEKFNKWMIERGVALDRSFYDHMPERVEELKSWLATLEGKEKELFANHVVAFSSGMNFELSWLFEQELNDEPRLKQALCEAIALYGLANLTAAQVQEELSLFMSYRAWQENPSSKSNQALTQELFTKLVDKGLAETAPTNLFLAPNKRRQKHAESAIHQAAAKDKESFYKILKEVME